MQGFFEKNVTLKKGVFVKDNNCFDGIRNGLEEAIDCGGPCEEKCKKKIPIRFIGKGMRLIIRLFRNWLSKPLAISNSLHRWDRLPSMKTTCAKSVAMEVAPRMEMETLAFFMATASLNRIL